MSWVMADNDWRSRLNDSTDREKRQIEDFLASSKGGWAAIIAFGAIVVFSILGGLVHF